MSYPADSIRPLCHLVSPYKCNCGGMNLDPSLPAARINYLQDAHVLGAELAGQIQIAREHALEDIEFDKANVAGYWDRMLSGSSPRLRHCGGGLDV